MRPIVRHTSAFVAALLGLLLLLGGMFVPAHADDDRDDHEAAMQALRSGEVRPLRDILGAVHGQFDGELLEAELERDDGAWVYELKLLGQRGNVMKLWYDATDGRLLDGRGHGLMRAWRGDAADLPEPMRRRHEHMRERGHGDHPRPWHHRWFGRFWGEDSGTEGGK